MPHFIFNPSVETPWDELLRHARGKGITKLPDFFGNVLMHLMGYLKKDMTSGDKQEFVTCWIPIESARCHWSFP